MAKIPLEIIDDILLLLPVTVAIQLGRDYPKRQLLSTATRDNVKSFAHAQWLHHFGVSGNWPRSAYFLFCKQEAVSNLIWLEQQYGTHITRDDRTYALDASVLHGTRVITHHLCDQDVDRTHAIRLATRTGDLYSMELLLQTEINEHPTAEVTIGQCIVDAAYYGYIHIVDFLHDSYPWVPLTEEMMTGPADKGHLNIVKWLCDHGLEWTSVSMAHAINKGHFDIVHFLQENRPREIMDDMLLIESVLAGDVRIFKYLYDQCAIAVTIPSTITAALTRAGHLHMLQYLNDNDLCLFDNHVFDAAIEAGQLKIVRWLHDNRPERCTINALLHAVRSRSLNMVAFVLNMYPEMREAERVNEALRLALYSDAQDIVSLLEDYSTTV